MAIGENSLSICYSFYEAIDKLSFPCDCLPMKSWERVYSNVLCRINAEESIHLAKNVVSKGSETTVVISKDVY